MVDIVMVRCGNPKTNAGIVSGFPGRLGSLYHNTYRSCPTFKSRYTKRTSMIPYLLVFH